MIKVLLVQPDSSAAGLLTRTLRDHEIECVVAASHKQAVRALDNDYLIDAVLVVMGQGGCCAGELLQEIRENVRYQYLPVIMMCESCAANTVVEALRRGATDVMSLPCADDQIARRVTAAVEKGKRRILVVDDEPVIREYLKDVLLIERFTPIAVSSAAEALEVLTKTTIHAVISDILMPGTNGMELLAQIKRDHAEVPVFMITAFSGRFSPQEALAAGADGFFQKPFKNVDLIRTLRSVLHIYGQSRKPSTLQARS